MLLNFLNRDKKILYIIICLVFLLIGGFIYAQKQSIKQYKSQIRKFKLENLAFEESIDNNGKALILQEQIILSQKDAIDQGLLKINNLKKVKSQVNVVTKTIIDTFIVAHTDTVVEYFNGNAFLKLPHSYDHCTDNLQFSALINKTGLSVSNINIPNSTSITIGYKGNGIFRKSTPVIELTHSNPYFKTNSVGNVVIKENKNLLTDPKVWGGVGLVLGLIIK